MTPLSSSASFGVNPLSSPLQGWKKKRVTALWIEEDDGGGVVVVLQHKLTSVDKK